MRPSTWTSTCLRGFLITHRAQANTPPSGQQFGVICTMRKFHGEVIYEQKSTQAWRNCLKTSRISVLTIVIVLAAKSGGWWEEFS